MGFSDQWESFEKLIKKETLSYFLEIWWSIFLWHVFSSIFIHTIAALVAFVTLRKHKFGRFFSIFIFVWGILVPLTSGNCTSALIAILHKLSIISISPMMAGVFGLSQTLIAACLGLTRILATL
ncbi:unnamed protein product [Diamesa hyperborea]